MMADGDAPGAWLSLLDTLLDYWEQGGDKPLRVWAGQYARDSFEAGVSASDMMRISHLVTTEIRAYLATHFWRRNSFLQAVNELEACMSRDRLKVAI